jgi:hypothetical protein
MFQFRTFQSQTIQCLYLAGLLLSLVLVADVEAQQFRVFTEVTQPSSDPETNDGRPDVIARSLTLFHAGKVFDWLPPPIGEVTVFEPAHRRFIIFNGRKLVKTTVTFDEIERLLATARDETHNYARQLEVRDEPGSKSIIEPLQFQLDPKFREQFDPTRQRLALRSPRFAYSVDCAIPAVPEASDAYLSYTDWAARLNYVLHPRSLFPAPRLKLNESLRGRGLVPVNVELHVRFDKPLQWNAGHRFSWKLEDADRQHINHWETVLRSDSLEWMTFREYQRVILRASTQAKR